MKNSTPVKRVSIALTLDDGTLLEQLARDFLKTKTEILSRGLALVAAELHDSDVVVERGRITLAMDE